MTKPKKNYKPDPVTAYAIAGAVADFKNLSEIAALLGLSEATLKYHYPGELLPLIERGLTVSHAHQPTDKNRQIVIIAASSGLPQGSIALMIGISIPTLVKYYDHELTVGHAQTSVQIANKLFQTAMNGDTTALIFWAKTRMKWSENPDIDVSENLQSVDIESLTLEQLRVLADLPIIEQ